MPTIIVSTSNQENRSVFVYPDTPKGYDDYILALLIVNQIRDDLKCNLIVERKD